MILLWALILQQHNITLREPIAPSNTSVEGVVICNKSDRVFYSYYNDLKQGKRGIVSSVTISGKEVPGLKEHLTEIAHNRAIQSITVRQCGPSETELRIFAEMELSESGSKRDGLPKLHFFRFNEKGLVELRRPPPRR